MRSVRRARAWSAVRMGVWTTGPSLATNSKSRPMGVKREQEVGEDDGCVDAEALGGGDGDFGGDFRGAADFEQGVVLADGHVLRHVAAGLAEEPDGGAVDGLAEAGTNEAAAVGPGSRCRLIYRGFVRGLRRCGHCPI